MCVLCVYEYKCVHVCAFYVFVDISMCMYVRFMCLLI